MLAALLLFALAPALQDGVVADTAAEADRIMAREAQTDGQHTALRRHAAPDALVLGPTPLPAEQALGGEDPKVAVQWWVADSYVSCDGRFAVNTGPWLKGPVSGYFTTFWARQPDGKWQWVADHGDQLQTPRPAGDAPHIHRASCANVPTDRADPSASGVTEGGSATDRSVLYHWQVRPDGGRTVSVMLWNGRKYDQAILDTVAPQAAQ